MKFKWAFGSMWEAIKANPEVFIISCLLDMMLIIVVVYLMSLVLI
jgi:hypothetical protein